jgi:hypothetical protein
LAIQAHFHPHHSALVAESENTRLSALHDLWREKSHADNGRGGGVYFGEAGMNTLRLRKLPGVRAWAVVESEPGCYECNAEEYLAFGKTAKLAWRHYVEKEEADWREKTFYKHDPSTYVTNAAQVKALFYGDGRALEVKPADNILHYAIASGSYVGTFF